MPADRLVALLGIWPCQPLQPTRCVYTWLMFASLFARTSHGISYPFLYRNSAASPRARSIEALASAIEPVMTAPTDGDILNT